MATLHARAISASALGLRKWTLDVTIAMLVLSLLAVTVRLLSRRIKQQKLWWDDWVCIMSLACTFIYVGLLMAVYEMDGLGLHIYEYDLSRIPHFFKVVMAGEVLYGFNVALTKTALLLLYYRLLQVAFQTSVTMRVAAYCIGVFVAITALLMLFLNVFLCTPIEKNWNPAVPGHCINYFVAWNLPTGMNIVTDVALLVLPIPSIWNMRLGVVEKLGVIATLGLGCGVVAISSYRPYLHSQFNELDSVYTITPIAVWAYIDIVVGIACCCLPVSKPVLFWITHRLRLTGDRAYLSRRRHRHPSRDPASSGKSDRSGDMESAAFTRQCTYEEMGPISGSRRLNGEFANFAL